VLLQPYEAKNPASQDTQQTGAALMPGVLVALHVQPGDQVVAGMVLAVVEAMKMENKLLAEEDGVVTVVHCALGDSVRAGQLIVSIEAAK
jgi:biotin carboxyl carrier protein